MAKYCKKCGTLLDVDTGLCPNKCNVEAKTINKANTALNEPLNEQKSKMIGNETSKKDLLSPQKTNSKKIIVTVLSIVVILIVAIFLLAFFGVFKIPFMENNPSEVYREEQSTSQEDPTYEATTMLTNDNLIADEDDFNNFVSLLKNIKSLGYLFEYSSYDSNAYRIVLSELFGPYTETPLYSYMFNKKAEYFDALDGTFENSQTAECDPLNKFGKFYRYGKLPADEIDWLIKNIFSATPNRNDSTIMDGEECQLYYYENCYYFACGDGGGLGVYPVIKTKHADENNRYTIECDLISCDDNATYEGTYEILCELKNIEGNRRWSLLSISLKSENEITTASVPQTQTSSSIETANIAQDIYPEDLISLTGILVTRKYEINDNNEGTVYILKLDDPIVVNFHCGDVYGDGTDSSLLNYTLSEIQCNFSDSSLAETNISKRVTVSGNPILSHTGHHLTDIVLIDCEITH